MGMVGTREVRVGRDYSTIKDSLVRGRVYRFSARVAGSEHEFPAIYKGMQGPLPILVPCDPDGSIPGGVPGRYNFEKEGWPVLCILGEVEKKVEETPFQQRLKRSLGTKAKAS